ncbi:hypothetical protein BCR36DRAFT_579184 [Piromyces finnis]|uniref:Uncharacterized protein n=1 Tax=Piromyces finnis TaxID=1754191 RepID=A0A1Y1VP05_9FUNG|nr:hypothetical protein BCR36DRAFT_579184 [Piromyces finnis]|eukprot:ORX61139.1 hypothetical protein BCR36DRAFT_579184 [Piromyces finnis]
MDIDTDWCLNCGKQTNGELYCSSQCRSQDEKGYKHETTQSFGFRTDNESIHNSGRSSPVMSSCNATSKYLNNPDKLLYYQSYDLKFRNRPSYDAGYYSPCLSSGLNQWLNQNVKMLTPSTLEQNRKSYMMETGRYHHHHHQSNIKFTSGFKGSYSSTSSESSYSSSSDTIIFGSSSSSNPNSLSMKGPNYPWNKIEDDDDISLYE